LPLANAAEGKGLSKLWARRKIADAEVARTTRQASPEDADKTILALALEHQLVTRLTSLVAVDKTPSRPEGAPLKVSELPINLQFRDLEWRAFRAARSLVDRNQAGQPRDELMLERERQDGLVGIFGACLPRGARDFGVRDLAPRPELGQALAFGRVRQRK